MMGQSSAVVLLHLRRLDSFLRRHRLHSTAHTLERESLVFFDAAHLQNLVRKGRWDAAWRYVHRFSLLFSEEGGEGPSQHYTAFLRTLEHHAMLHYLACRGDEGGRDAKSLYSRVPDDAFRDKFHEMAKQHDLYRTMASPQARASLNWDHIKLTTLEKLHELLHLHPDIQCSLRMRLPQHTPTLSDIAPLGLRGPRRYHQRKRIDCKPAHELAYFLLQKSLPSVEIKNHFGDSGVPMQPTLTSDAKPLGITSSVAPTKVLEPNLASEARTAGMSASVASTGVKRTRYQVPR
ncbi:hypothetical protein QOZ80_1BG0050890 [Eleusine coracana subsp. coracana]|nr:hypothetical protein QOZ80_1BG0050890 [Eleusine coracana subsp. coracana]